MYISFMPGNANELLSHLLDQDQPFILRMSNHISIGADMHIAEREIPDHLLYYLSAGRLHARVDGESFTLHPGQLLWVQPYVSHAFDFDKNSKSGAIYFMRFKIGKHHGFHLPESFRLSPGNKHIENSWDQINLRHREQSPFSDLRLRCHLTDFLIQILTLSAEQQQQCDGLRPQQKTRAINFIHQHLHLRFSIDEVAAQLDMNTDYFGRQFKKTFGQTPQAYIKQERIHQACGLLSESGRSISDVAATLGYEDPYFFSRQFKAVMKLSPRHWLERQ